MQMLCIDESGSISCKNNTDNPNYFTLGGIIIPEIFWHEIDKELASLKRNFQIAGEIKWRYFSPQKSEKKLNALSHLNVIQKEKLRSALYNLIIKFEPVHLICAVVDIQSTYKLQNVQTENDLYWFAYKQIIERFQYYLQDLSSTIDNKINGIVVCDHRQPKDDHQLRVLHHNLLTGSKNHFSIYQNLIEGVFIAPSHLSVGIQLADMVAGAVYRKFVRNDARFFDLIKASLLKNQSGSMEGYGLIKCPEDYKDAVSGKPVPASIDAVTA